ncbi:hypothetical protein PSTT_13810 [Puccinia striiformis]|uniref:Uncharacterized protein n=1 Tax=Puccinia striiformis TaxID=27350 RepID=A0A2S4UQ40_9BASI|nr:hypothetical protein PSTT_13810 [Puccinia striiformis]
MPALLSGQRFHHAFHPYQTISQASRGPLSCCVRLISPMTMRPGSSKAKTTTQQAPYSTRLVGPKSRPSTNSTPLNQPVPPPGVPSPTKHCLVKSDESTAPFVVAPSVPASQPLLAILTPTNHSASSAKLPSQGSRRPAQAANLDQVSLGTQGTPDTIQSPLSSNSTSTSRSAHPAHRGIVRYLKSWNPPVEYYARRRRQHPSLSFPSRQPSLPSLLEERVTKDGKMDVVRPEVAMSTSLRAYQRKVFAARSNVTRPVSQHAQSWDDDSEEESGSDEDDDDEDDDEDEDSEALTPSSSPVPSATYFLQPLLLTKLSGY